MPTYLCSALLCSAGILSSRLLVVSSSCSWSLRGEILPHLLRCAMTAISAWFFQGSVM